MYTTSFYSVLTNGAPSAAQANNWTFFAMVALMIGVFYFLLIRPQNKRAKEHRLLIESLGTGTEIITSGGVYGKIKAIKENILVLEIANGVDVLVQKHHITTILPKGTIKTLE